MPRARLAAPQPPYAAVFLASAAALAWEVLLIRLLAIKEWHHFAFMVVSLALFGYGAAGSCLAFARDRLLARFPAAFTGAIFLFAVSLPAAAGLARHIAFNAEALFWSPRELPALFALYLVLAIPFFFAALTNALAFARLGEAIPALYAADLAGGAAGSAAAVLLLHGFAPQAILRWLPLPVLAGVALTAGRLGLRRGVILPVAVALGVLLAAVPTDWLAPAMSPYKGLPQALLRAGARVVAERSGPLGLLTAVESPAIPWRYAPGLSLAAPQGPPPQVAIFSDGDGLTALDRNAAAAGAESYLAWTTSAAAYRMASPRKVAILGAGGGTDVRQALYHGAEEVVAVELNPQLVALVRELEGGGTGVYGRKDVRVVVGEARGFLRESRERFDLVQISLLDSLAGSSAGLGGLTESYLYTVEALAEYLGRLAPGGCLAITRWVQVPPRDGLKIFATAVKALESLEISEPGKRLVLIRGLTTCTLVVKNGEFSATELERMQGFCASRAFDAEYFPGMEPGGGNRINILPEPYFSEGAQQILAAGRENYYDQYPLAIRPARDDRPYFFQFFRWRSFGELLRLRGQGGLGQVEWGYVVLVATLIQAVAAGGVLILLPLALLRRKREGAGGAGRVFVYFSALGLAFLFLEIACIQKAIRFLHHPLYASAVVIAVFLAGAGCGSFTATRLLARYPEKVLSRRAVAALLLLGGLFLAGSRLAADFLLALPLPARFGATALLFGPLAFTMGMPFPLGLRALGRNSPELLPWAYGVNGCASVASAVLAMLLAVHAGFQAVIGAGLLLYALAGFCFPAAGAAEGINVSSRHDSVAQHSAPA